MKKNFYLIALLAVTVLGSCSGEKKGNRFRSK